MNIALVDHTNQLPTFLSEFRTRPLSFSDCSHFPERYTARLIPTAQPTNDLRSCNLDFLFAYRIFPSFILHSVQEWQLEQRPMAIGDLIIQQAMLPPTPLSLKCIFAVRILSITRSADWVGFTYGTLVGHAETGTSSFAFVKQAGDVFAVIHTFSKPGNLLSRIVAPFFTLPYQQFCTNLAVEQMRTLFIAHN